MSDEAKVLDRWIAMSNKRPQASEPICDRVYWCYGPTIGVQFAAYFPNGTWDNLGLGPTGKHLFGVTHWWSGRANGSEPPEEPTLSRWIPVSERLPEEDTEVLAYRDERVDLANYFGIRRGLPQWELFNSDTVSDVTHWQPLPEPPKP